MQKELIIHIGMSKTGTSAIQDACWKRRNELAAAGIVYPRTGLVFGKAAHHGLAWGITGRQGFQAGVWEDLWTECAHARRILISAESFWLMDDGQVATLATLTSGFHVKILLYLRDPVEYLVSSYRQAIQTGKTRASFERWLPERRGRLNYLTLFNRWAQYYDVEVLDYNAERSDLIPRFFLRFGLVVTANDEVHVTPSMPVLRIMLWVNRVEPIIGSRVARLVRRKVAAW